MSTLPPGAKHQVTVKFTDALTPCRLLAELPIGSLQFSKVLGGAGSWSGNLNTEDPDVQKAYWIAATATSRTSVWIDIDGTLFFGGRVLQRKHVKSTGIAAVGGDSFSGYMSQRLQAKEYENYIDPEGHHWAESTPSIAVGKFVLEDAFARAYSLPIGVTSTDPNQIQSKFWVPFSAPLAQQQSVSSIVGQMQELGLNVGFDYADTVAYTGSGCPSAAIDLSYPYRGFGASKAKINITSALDSEWDEDGSQQADLIIEQAGATTVRSSRQAWAPAREAGYPLLEMTISNPASAPTVAPNSAMLEALVSGALAARAYPALAPTLTLPLFGEPSIFELDVGDIVTVYVPKLAGDQAATYPRFPDGLEADMRIVRIDVVIPDEGVPIMVLTLNLPPSEAGPVLPPETMQESNPGETSEKEQEEKNEEEKPGEEEEKETAENVCAALKAEAEADLKEAEEAVAESFEDETKALAAQKKAKEALEAEGKAALKKAQEAETEASAAEAKGEEARTKANTVNASALIIISESAAQGCTEAQAIAEHAKKLAEEALNRVDAMVKVIANARSKATKATTEKVIPPIEKGAEEGTSAHEKIEKGEAGTKPEGPTTEEANTRKAIEEAWGGGRTLSASKWTILTIQGKTNGTEVPAEAIAVTGWGAELFFQMGGNTLFGGTILISPGTPITVKCEGNPGQYIKYCTFAWWEI